MECARAMFDGGRGDLVRHGLLEMQIGGTSHSGAEGDHGASAWHTVRAVITKGGSFCWFSQLIDTPHGLEGPLVPDGSIALEGGKGFSVEPAEAPHFDLVESGSWGRSKKRHKFRAMTVEESVDWILLFKDYSSQA